MPDQDAHKTITFSFDGTGTESSDARRFTEDESVSNVLKLRVLMGGGFEADRTDTKTEGGEDQVTFYYNGIGTCEEGRSIPLLGRLRDALNMAMAPRWGDAARILQEARRDFEGVGYEEGDRVVVFGFSRGAALARKFASRILGEGLCGEVAFLGVFDTVAAMDGIHRKGEKISTDVVFENGPLYAHSGLDAVTTVLELASAGTIIPPTAVTPPIVVVSRSEAQALCNAQGDIPPSDQRKHPMARYCGSLERTRSGDQ